MAVYVDVLLCCRKCKQWPYNKSCHMYADGDDELHRMAQRLGLRRAWFQDSTRLPHYDLTPGKRIEAIGLGAIETDRYHVVKHMRPMNVTAKLNEG